jgi:hypothetical protein
MYNKILITKNNIENKGHIKEEVKIINVKII